MFVDDVFKEHAIKFEDQVPSYGSEHVSFIWGRLLNVKADANAIEIEKKDGSTEEVTYDVLVLATGGGLVSPWRAEADKLASLDERF